MYTTTDPFVLTYEKIRETIMNSPTTYVNDNNVLKPIFRDYKDYKIYSEKNTIKKVIYNDPATIILWADGTKTVAKCEDSDYYSPEAGFAICVAKHYRENYYHDLNKSIKVTQEQWDKYKEMYGEDIAYWTGYNTGDKVKYINLSKVNHLDIEDKLAIVKLERVKNFVSLVKER